MVYKGDIYYIKQITEGNTIAFSNLVDHHKDKAFNLAFRICGSREEAEEITQDAFMKAYKALSSFKMKSSFATWLYRIVYNTAISLVRIKKKGILSIEDFPADATDFIGNNTTEEEAEAEYRNSLVNFALQKLTEDERGLISFYYYEEMTTDEIADITGINKSNIKVKLFRARQKMMEIVEKVEKKNLTYHGETR
jgi:RNA polymerase sigma-70 factor (ECF subfamily)